MGGGTIHAQLGGVAVVCCVHDREKRQVRTEAAVAELGTLLGRAVDPTQDRLFECACCENLFVSRDDMPQLCYACQRPLAHPLGGPLREPTGRV